MAPPFAISIIKLENIMNKKQITALLQPQIITIRETLIAANKNKWNSLPSDLQKILTDTTGSKMAKKCGLTLDQGSINDSKWMKSQGHEFYVLSPVEKKKFAATTQEMHEAWIKSMEKKGYKNARQIHDDIVSSAAAYSKSTIGGYKE